ncbi:MAG: MBL fold metallo-hydrolase [Chloroflexota bacterium]
MRIRFHGAAHTVTGSQHLIEVNGARVLLDCGLFQGRRSETYERNETFPFDPTKIDAVILSHAHIDHSGNLPNLVKQGFSRPIYTTPATASLTDLMLRDSGHIQEKQAETVTWRNLQRGKPPVEPLYTEEDAKQVAPLLHEISYDKEFEPAPGVIARFVDAGHILGSAAVVLELEEKGQKKSLWFSGDIGRRKLPILRDPVLPDKCDYLVMESTYGDKPHRDPEEAYVEMRDVVLRTLKRGGKVIIPAFAVGRTQELVHNLSRMYEEGSLPRVPIYVDSPLAVNASKVFKQHPECYDADMLAEVNSGHPALEFKYLTYIQSLEDSKALNERKDPMIIISAAGMAETGRVVFHIRWNIENPLNTVMIVSWQAPDTLGRRLADREKQIKIFGEPYHVRAEIATIGGLSAHAGQDLLSEYALSSNGRTQQIFLVHGEEKPAMLLKDALKTRKMDRVHYPALHESVDL